MYDRELAIEQLTLIELAAHRIVRRIEGMTSPSDLTNTEEGQLRFDGVLMIVAIGEQLKRMDKHVPSEVFVEFPGVDWVAAKGMRDRISHGYFEADAPTTFHVATSRFPELLAEVSRMKRHIQGEMTDGSP